MSLVIENLPEAIRISKQQLRAALPGYKEIFGDVEAEIRRRVEEIVTERAAGHDVVPIVQYSDIDSGKVSPELVKKIKSRGACVVRSTFSREQATAWDEEIAAYVENNNLDAKLANAAEDKYFGTLASAKPRIYGIYWSRPQVQARQSKPLTKVRVFLNNLWLSESQGVRHFTAAKTSVVRSGCRADQPSFFRVVMKPRSDFSCGPSPFQQGKRKPSPMIFPTTEPIWT